MLSQEAAAQTLQIQIWPIESFVPYARNPRKNDAAVDRMCSSIREFGFKIPVLARSNGDVVDGHLRLKAARKLGSWPGGDTAGIPVILCDEWSEAQVKAFRLMVNRSVDVGGVGRGTARARTAGTQRRGFRSRSHRLQPQGNRRPAGASGRGESQRSAAAPREPGLAHWRPVALRKASRALRRLHQRR